MKGIIIGLLLGLISTVNADEPTTLREAAKGTHVNIGTAINWRFLLKDKAYGERAAKEYDLITPEN
jgi:hypothetical protein